jgi:hypothetical protein
MTAVLPVRNPSRKPAEQDAGGEQTELSFSDAEASKRFWEAVIAARKLLTRTVEAVDPDTPAEQLLGFVKDYRTCLAELVAVLPVPDGGDDV